MAPVSAPPLSPETLTFLRELLGQVSLTAGAPNFTETAAKITNAIDELDAALAAHGKRL